MEVGCGLGYLTYALDKSQFNVTGIDISNKAIELAIKRFGNLYFNDTLESYLSKKTPIRHMLYAPS